MSPSDTSLAAPVAVACNVPSDVGQSMPKNGTPRITLDGGTTAAYSSAAVWSENIPLVSGDDGPCAAARFGLYSMTKNASTAPASAGMSNQPLVPEAELEYVSIVTW